VSDVTAERVARNEAAFRGSNEHLEARGKELGFAADELTPFLCECADPGCTTLLRLTRTEYEAERRSPVRFVYARGHERSSEGWGRVVDEFERYTVVEKVGEAAEIAVALDEGEEVRDERAEAADR